MGQRDKGKLIAKLLWSELILEPDGSDNDRDGTDGYLYNHKVQIKYDGRIASSGNLYHEIYEKSANQPTQDWRKSPVNANYYIFCTETNIEYIGFLVTLDNLACAEIGKTLKALTPNQGSMTSLGFLIKTDHITVKDKRIKPKTQRFL